MSFFRACALSSLALLIACNGSNPGGTAGQSTKSGPLAGKVPDIVADTNDLALGKGWYLFETFNGQSFRWVNNDAEIIVKNPRSNVKNVALELEAGPSLGTKNFALQVREASRVVQTIRISGHQRVVATVPVRQGSFTTFALHVNGGGKHITDPRILNFRVFSVADADIVDPNSGIVLGRNWDVVERFAGRTFRWVDNDAAFSVVSNGAKTEKIHIVSLPGPGLGGHPLAVQVRNASEAAVATLHPDKNGDAIFSAQLKPGSNSFTLHVAGGGQRTSSDPRILNFRVFLLAPAG